MKHPLTSKERRGLVAVAAAALFCIGTGFTFRGCAGRSQRAAGEVVVVDNDSTARLDTVGRLGDSLSPEAVTARESVPADSVGSEARADSIASKYSKKNGKRARRAARKRTSSEKTYPTRSPLDEPCD